MAYQHPIPKEIEVVDRYGDARIIHQTPNGLKLRRDQLTAAIVLNQAVAQITKNRITALRTAKGWTFAELADRAGLPGGKSRMWEIENTLRKTGRSFGTVYAIAMALGCEATDLLPTIAEIATIAAPQKRTVVGVR